MKINTFEAQIVEIVTASVAQFLRENNAPVAQVTPAPEKPAKPSRVYPSLDAVRASGWGVPEDATMAVLTSTGKLFFYAVAENGAREEYDAYHVPSKKLVAQWRAEFAHTAPQA